MANEQGIVTLRGRFKAGALVRLVRVKDEGVLRPAEDAVVVEERLVDGQGCVQFSSGVEVGARYFVVGQIDGTPAEVRVRGNRPGEDNSLLVQAPVSPERQKLADGRFQDELVAPGAPRQAEKPEPEPEPEKPAGKPAARKPAGKSGTSAAKSPARKSTTAKSAASGSARKGK